MSNIPDNIIWSDKVYISDDSLNTMKVGCHIETLQAFEYYIINFSVWINTSMQLYSNQNQLIINNQVIPNEERVNNGIIETQYDDTNLDDYNKQTIYYKTFRNKKRTIKK